MLGIPNDWHDSEAEYKARIPLLDFMLCHAYCRQYFCLPIVGSVYLKDAQVDKQVCLLLFRFWLFASNKRAQFHWPAKNDWVKRGTDALPVQTFLFGKRNEIL